MVRPESVKECSPHVNCEGDDRILIIATMKP